MTKTEAVARAGNANKLAALLGISPQAVSKWPETIPPLRLYQLREKKPRWFRKARA
jgi:predicted transcriptional regulator